MLASTGVPTQKDLDKVFPSDERLSKGPTVIVECFQNIPCNPCYTACRTGSIKEFEDINDLPNVDHDLCNGCSLCVSNCPGLAISVLDMTYSDEEALLKIPYELIPLPTPNQIVKGLDREGKEICEVRVVKVINSKALDKTPIISIAVKKDFAKIIRNIRLEE
ncbi:4Fe-4S binding protein [Alkaliphilus peptidifermentans]|uniref:4Fe-4S binding domain-containing protein n=1 Tax=Alkaliphilus peptidifermentans DSM 18978 TaxID=1120976 RepID=A0A1G5D8F4_9FIRM|nr:4Fe-4S binding protein [Alkaliphilus peptidifermentans]SCY10992.1 4Fe-4S binding domain-containing protein [Alkaliphilus peptidifermentans DSM 18978]